MHWNPQNLYRIKLLYMEIFDKCTPFSCTKNFKINTREFNANLSLIWAFFWITPTKNSIIQLIVVNNNVNKTAKVLKR